MSPQEPARSTPRRMLPWIAAPALGLALGALIAGSCTQTTNAPPPRIAPPEAVRSPQLVVAPDPTLAPLAPPPLTWPEHLTPIEHPEALQPLLDKLVALRQRRYDDRVRVLHYGDSHIAADVWTGTLRRNLQAEFGDGGRGWVVPGKPWPSYRPLDAASGVENPRYWHPERIKSRYTPDRLLLGLGGIAVWTEKRGAAAWAAVEDGDAAQHVELFFLQHPTGARLTAQLDGGAPQPIDTHGPAQTGGYKVWDLPQGARRLDIAYEGPRGAAWLYGAVFERDTPGVVYDAVGINGARATMPLLWDQPLWVEHLQRRAPDLLVTTYGTNEVDDRLDHDAYAAAFKKVLLTLKSARPDAACLVLAPPDRAWKVTGDGLLSEHTLLARQRAADAGDRTVWDTPQPLLDIIATQRRVAAEVGCAFWDTFAAMGGKGSIDAWARQSPPLAARDRVHLSKDGYAEVADRLTQALLHLVAYHEENGGLGELPPAAGGSPALK